MVSGRGESTNQKSVSTKELMMPVNMVSNSADHKAEITDVFNRGYTDWKAERVENGQRSINLLKNMRNNR
jgi:hypothetical protein